MSLARPSFAAATVAAAALLLAAAGARAQSGIDRGSDDQDQPWREAPIQLPAAPAAENLLPFYVSATATQEFAIDPASVTVGPDGVVRYTLVAKSPEGATSVSYEGIRCASFEKKLYAFGRPNGDWTRSRLDRWERISTGDANRQHAALAKDYFCEEKTVAGKAQDMVERIRWQRPLTPHRGD